MAGKPPPDVAPIDVPVHVVGIVRGGVFAGGLQTTDAFYAQHAADLIPPGVGYVNAIVRLEGGRARWRRSARRSTSLPAGRSR